MIVIRRVDWDGKFKRSFPRKRKETLSKAAVWLRTSERIWEHYKTDVITWKHPQKIENILRKNPQNLKIDCSCFFDRYNFIFLIINIVHYMAFSGMSIHSWYQNIPVFAISYGYHLFGTFESKFLPHLSTSRHCNAIITKSF